MIARYVKGTGVNDKRRRPCTLESLGDYPSMQVQADQISHNCDEQMHPLVLSLGMRRDVVAVHA